MNEFLTQIAGGLVGLLGALTAYIKIAGDRKKSAEKRDASEDNINTRVTLLETKVNSLEELKAEVKALKESVDRLLGFLQAKYSEGIR